MSYVPTVRVANPVDRTKFMTINAADYRELVHGPLWEEQAPGFAGLPAPAPAQYSDAERRYAAELMLETLAFKLRTEGVDFAALSPGERMVCLRDARNELERAVRDHANWTQRASSDNFASEFAAKEAERRAAMTKEERERDDALKEGVRRLTTPPARGPNPGAQVGTGEYATGATKLPEQPVPGETAGHPVNAETGRPLELTEETRASLAANPVGGGGEVVTGQAGATQSQGSGPAPSWAKPAPPKGAVTIEKGVGGRWYGMRDGKPITEGYAKRADAEKAAESPSRG